MKKCPICKSLNTQFFTKKILNYYICNKCKTLFVLQKPKFEKIKKFYKYDFDYNLQNYKLKKETSRYNKIFNNLKRINPKGKTLLDIGAGYGIFLRVAEKNKIKLTAIEPSNKFYQGLKKIRNLKIINTTFEEFYKKNRLKKLKFDYITMFHVLEHCQNPKTWLKMVKKLLNKNGVLYIETPNLDSHLFRFEKKNYTFLIPFEHLWIFSINSFKFMIKELKTMEIKKVFTYSHPEHFAGILKTIIKGSNKHKSQKEKGLKIKVSNLKNELNLSKKIKYVLFDKIFAPIFTPILNINNQGSIFGLYILKH